MEISTSTTQATSTSSLVLIDIYTLFQFDEHLWNSFHTLHPSKHNVSGIPPLPNPRSDLDLLREVPGGKNKAKLSSIYNTPGFFKNLIPKQDSQVAIQWMINSPALDVRVLISHTMPVIPPQETDTFLPVTEQVDWLVSHFGGARWREKVIIAVDPTLINADLYISSELTPEQYITRIFEKKTNRRRAPSQLPHRVSWKHILFSEPWNTSSSTPKPRLSCWKFWKQEISSLIPSLTTTSSSSNPSASLISWESTPCYYHGSADSVDKDSLYLLSSSVFPWPTGPERNKILEQLVRGFTDDRNLFQIDESTKCVNNCFRGYPDEIHNALIRTYDLHSQHFPLWAGILNGDSKLGIQRNVAVKILGGVRGVVVKVFKRRGKKGEGKVLRSRKWSIVWNQFKTLDFEDVFQNVKLDEEEKEWSDDVKYVAFQIGQMLSLVYGKDVYTKSEVIQLWPEMSSVLKREGYTKIQQQKSLSQLNKLKHELVDQVEKVEICDLNNEELEKIERKMDLKTIRMKNQTNNNNIEGSNEQDAKKSPMNLLESQARGLVIDAHEGTGGRVVLWGLNQSRGETKQDIWWEEDQDSTSNQEVDKPKKQGESEKVNIAEYKSVLVIVGDHKLTTNTQSQQETSESEAVKQVKHWVTTPEAQKILPTWDLQHWWCVVTVVNNTPQLFARRNRSSHRLQKIL